MTPPAPIAVGTPVDATETGGGSGETATDPKSPPEMDPLDPAMSTTVVDVSTLTADDMNADNGDGAPW